MNIYVWVKPPVATAIQFNASSVKLQGYWSTYQLSVIATPSDAEVNMVYESNNENKYTVNSTGLVTLVSNSMANATITWTDLNSWLTCTCSFYTWAA